MSNVYLMFYTFTQLIQSITFYDQLVSFMNAVIYVVLANLLRKNELLAMTTIIMVKPLGEIEATASRSSQLDPLNTFRGPAEN